MADKKFSRSALVLLDSKTSQWCYVNIDNEFNFIDNTYVIDSNVEEYRVYNKAGEVEDYTNESYMEEVLAILYKDGVLKFYNQNFELIEDSNINVKK